MEDHIQENAEWKKIQEKTFTRWCNEQLKLREIVVDDLNGDLQSGVNLIALLEVLSGKKVGRYNKKPRIHAQRMENVELCLNFITVKEKIRLVNIGQYEWILHQLYSAANTMHYYIYEIMFTETYVIML